MVRYTWGICKKCGKIIWGILPTEVSEKLGLCECPEPEADEFWVEIREGNVVEMSPNVPDWIKLSWIKETEREWKPPTREEWTKYRPPVEEVTPQPPKILTPEEKEQKIKELAEEFGMSVEEVKKILAKKGY